MTRFLATNSVFKKNDETNRVPISTPDDGNSERIGDIIDKLNKLLEQKSENSFELYVKDVEKGGTLTEKENPG